MTQSQENEFGDNKLNFCGPPLKEIERGITSELIWTPVEMCELSFTNPEIS